ncbi:hypothetical protein A3A64_03960 [Candidatus Gottesmanbacteria bacterium RIFCSPLOWO2_01_FULL_48_11]|uniref:D-alanine--D-alanine ligase n=3 Tax=Patescibacteria group TaxID=1783273 RepID=A0A1F6AUR6_9BACT|nr:MAG: D-alanine-D-alanine ligase [Parcubacteria group bacterium GW2011_GWA2_46_10]KKU21430.1 MAG: D-alanine-D-alanine ligase [Candidatus Nomurabacteria bacterium GW2011_GWA1_46_11]OGG28431.1 MAG: hypothetical protein A3A64_03960 [Candidatus Gottesmanbacteria bacterium RIFCSPLOWO2_01_FULL_48_11]OGY56331.1 MAG: hypothetical protein A2119_02070 [Candidatus Colwellbacteria bacterium GWA2_46_10]
MNIGIFFGSRSPEHDVSIITGTLIAKGLGQLGHKVVPVYISKEGSWYVGEPLGDLNFYKQTSWQSKLNQYANYTISTHSPKGKMVLTKPGISKKSFIVDIAFPAFHGANGEDGTIQGLFEIFNIPYVGCDVLSSAVTMDKVLTKELYEKYDIPTTKFIYFSKSQWEEGRSLVLERLKGLDMPVFIKPARLGSSIGITRATNEKEVILAVEVALHYDDKILIEDVVPNLIDITCAVLGNENPKASLLQESAFQGEFFSYAEKYLEEGGAQFGKAEKKLIIPSSLDKITTQKIQDLSVKVYKLLGCSGTARVDFLYNKASSEFFANEVNTLPGTLYHHLWKASGVSFSELLTELLNLAQERYQRKQRLTYTFESDILSQANFNKAKLQGLSD